jgi:hypothetical protein
MGPDFIVTAQGNMDNPPVMSIHIADGNGTTDAFAFCGHALGVLDKIIFSVF